MCDKSAETTPEYEECLAQEDLRRNHEEQEYQKYLKAVEEWRAKWPNRCQSCCGWGGATSYQSHPYGMGSAEEAFFDICEALPENTCHRCGAKGLTTDGEGPCTACGWDFNDGEPQW